MRSVVIPAIVLLGIGTACEKCQTCKAYDIDTDDYVFGKEICGRKVYVELEVAGFKNGWDNDSTYVVCTED